MVPWASSLVQKTDFLKLSVRWLFLPLVLASTSSAQYKIIDKTKDMVRLVTFREEWTMRVTALLGQLDTRQIGYALEDCTFYVSGWAIFVVYLFLN